MSKCQSCPSSAPATNWQRGFMKLLPAIERHARCAFRVLDAEARDDAVAEVLANAVCAYQRLHERNELQRAFATTLAKFAIKSYWSGRRCGTSQCSHDVFSSQAKQVAAYEVRTLGTPGELSTEWSQCLVDNRLTSVPNQVAFRMDFPRWLRGLSLRDRNIAERLSLGYSTKEVAAEFGMSSGRVSQLRREFSYSWYKFIRVNRCLSGEPKSKPGRASRPG